MRSWRSLLEIRDLVLVLGFGLAVAGGVRLSVPWTLIMAGVLLMVSAKPWRG